MKLLHDAYRKKSRVVAELWKKLSYQGELPGTVLDDDSNNDIITSPETEQFLFYFTIST